MSKRFFFTRSLTKKTHALHLTYLPAFRFTNKSVIISEWNFKKNIQLLLQHTLNHFCRLCEWQILFVADHQNAALSIVDYIVREKCIEKPVSDKNKCLKKMKSQQKIKNVKTRKCHQKKMYTVVAEVFLTGRFKQFFFQSAFHRLKPRC